MIRRRGSRCRPPVLTRCRVRSTLKAEARPPGSLRRFAPYTPTAGKGRTSSLPTRQPSCPFSQLRPETRKAPLVPGFSGTGATANIPLLHTNGRSPHHESDRAARRAGFNSRRIPVFFEGVSEQQLKERPWNAFRILDHQRISSLQSGRHHQGYLRRPLPSSFAKARRVSVSRPRLCRSPELAS
jgi:hypothetical protein